MATVRNYFFATRKDSSALGLVDYRNRDNSKFSLFGNCYDREGFSDGKLIVTSSIVTVSSELYDARTASGSIYQLEDMSHDYQRFLYSIDNDIPVIRDFRVSGNLRNGYYLITNTLDRVKVVSEEEDFLIIESCGEEIKVFVDWTSWRFNQLEILLFGKIDDTDLMPRDLVKFCADKCKIKFFK